MQRAIATLALAVALPATAIAGALPAHATPGRSTTGPVAVKQLVYRHGVAASDSDLWTMNADGTGKVALPKSTSKNATTINSGAHDGSPWMSPDGKWLAFASDRTGSNHVWVAELSTGTVRDVAPSVSTSAAPVGWYVDETGAQRVVYVVGTSPSPYQLFSVRPDGTGARAVTDRAYPMGRSDVAADGHLAVAGDLDGSGQRRIWIALIGAAPLGAASFTAVTNPPDGEDDNSPGWARSGALAFSRGPAGSPRMVIDLLPPGANEATTPARTIVTQGQEPGIPMYSRDGAQLDYTTNPDGSPTHDQIWVVRTDPATGAPVTAGDPGVQVTSGTYGDWQGTWR